MKAKDYDRIMNFIGGRTQELIRNGISVHLTYKDAINKLYGGSFCAHNKVFRVAMGNGMDSIHSFIHEYAHFLQFRNNKAFWDRKIEKGVYTFFGWLDGDAFTPAEVERSLRLTIEIEHDCEMTALKVISAYELPVDPSTYSRVCGMNLMRYHIVARDRKWTTGGYSVNDDLSVLEYMPAVLPKLSFFLDKENIQKFLEKHTA